MAGHCSNLLAYLKLFTYVKFVAASRFRWAFSHNKTYTACPWILETFAFRLSRKIIKSQLSRTKNYKQ